MAKQSPPFNHLAAAHARDQRTGQSPKQPSQAPQRKQGERERDASGHFTQSTSKKTSQALSVTTKTPTTASPAKTTSSPRQNVSAPPAVTPQRTSKNINDPSYREQQTPPPTSNRISDQMQIAKNDPRSQQLTQKNIAAKKEAREQLKQRPRAGLQPLSSRNETGHTQVFQNASKITHLRNQGREVNQEAGRPQRMALNPRPGQRVHPK